MGDRLTGLIAGVVTLGSLAGVGQLLTAPALRAAGEAGASEGEAGATTTAAVAGDAHPGGDEYDDGHYPRDEATTTTTTTRATTASTQRRAPMRRFEAEQCAATASEAGGPPRPSNARQGSCTASDRATRSVASSARRSRDVHMFTLALAEQVRQYQEELDELIRRHASDWPVEPIAPLERSITWVALLEMLYPKLTPGASRSPQEGAIDKAVGDRQGTLRLLGAGLVTVGARRGAARV